MRPVHRRTRVQARTGALRAHVSASVQKARDGERTLAGALIGKQVRVARVWKTR